MSVREGQLAWRGEVWALLLQVCRTNMHASDGPSSPRPSPLLPLYLGVWKWSAATPLCPATRRAQYMSEPWFIAPITTLLPAVLLRPYQWLPKLLRHIPTPADGSAGWCWWQPAGDPLSFPRSSSSHSNSLPHSFSHYPIYSTPSCACRADWHMWHRCLKLQVLLRHQDNGIQNYWGEVNYQQSRVIYRWTTRMGWHWDNPGNRTCINLFITHDKCIFPR